MEYKDLLGGKGANLAEMTSVLKLPVPPGFTISTDACRAYMHGGWPAGLDDEIAAHVAKLETTMGRQLGDPDRPAARQRALGRQVLDAGDDGHRPQPRPQRQEREGPGRGDRRRALRLRLATAASSRCTAASCSTSTATASSTRSRRPRSAAGVTTDAEIPAAALKELCDAVQGGRQGGHRQAVPAGPDEAAARRRRGRVPQLERRPRHRLPRPRAHQPRPRHGRQRADDGVRQPRRQLGHRRRLHPQRGHRREQALRRLPHQRPGRGRRRRHPQHRGPRRA